MGSEMSVFSDRWMAVTLILLPPASRWALLPSLPLKGHLDMLPPGSHPIIYTLYTHLFSPTNTQHQWFSATLLAPSTWGLGV